MSYIYDPSAPSFTLPPSTPSHALSVLRQPSTVSPPPAVKLGHPHKIRVFHDTVQLQLQLAFVAMSTSSSSSDGGGGGSKESLSQMEVHAVASAAAAAAGPVELSGTMVRFITKEGNKFDVPLEHALQSKMVKVLVDKFNAESGAEDEDSDHSEDEDAEDVVEIPISTVDNDTLARIIKYMAHHFNNPAAPIVSPLTSNNLNDSVSDPFDRDFITVEQNVLHSLVAASTYLDVEPLLKLACTQIAAKIYGHTPEEAYAYFGITGDLTDEELAKVYQQYPFLAPQKDVPAAANDATSVALTTPSTSASK